jgi:hypothetical protein
MALTQAQIEQFMEWLEEICLRSWAWADLILRENHLSQDQADAFYKNYINSHLNKKLVQQQLFPIRQKLELGLAKEIVENAYKEIIQGRPSDAQAE